MLFHGTERALSLVWFGNWIRFCLFIVFIATPSLSYAKEDLLRCMQLVQAARGALGVVGNDISNESVPDSYAQKMITASLRESGLVKLPSRFRPGSRNVSVRDLSPKFTLHLLCQLGANSSNWDLLAGDYPELNVITRESGNAKYNLFDEQECVTWAQGSSLFDPEVLTQFWNLAERGCTGVRKNEPPESSLLGTLCTPEQVCRQLNIPLVSPIRKLKKKRLPRYEPVSKRQCTGSPSGFSTGIPSEFTKEQLNSLSEQKRSFYFWKARLIEGLNEAKVLVPALAGSTSPTPALRTLLLEASAYLLSLGVQEESRDASYLREPEPEPEPEIENFVLEASANLNLDMRTNPYENWVDFLIGKSKIEYPQFYSVSQALLVQETVQGQQSLCDMCGFIANSVLEMGEIQPDICDFFRQTYLQFETQVEEHFSGDEMPATEFLANRIYSKLGLTSNIDSSEKNDDEVSVADVLGKRLGREFLYELTLRRMDVVSAASWKSKHQACDSISSLLLPAIKELSAIALKYEGGEPSVFRHRALCRDIGCCPTKETFLRP